MSKDTSNLRLLGSPVSLTQRGKKNKKNFRNRPQSALQNSCLTPDLPERCKRPFSADAKTGLPTYNNFLKAIALEVRQCNHSKNIRIVPPTTEILENSATHDFHKHSKELGSNASDYGSEDTYISLGTKIKAKAQAAPKTRNAKNKNYLKYRNIALKGKPVMDSHFNNTKMENDDAYGVDVKITEKTQSLNNFGTGDRKFKDQHDVSPVAKAHFDSYFIPFEDGISKDRRNESVDFDDSKIGNTNTNSTKNIYTRSLTKQQLSLVEEESTQDLESVPSQNLSSSSPENSDGFLSLTKTNENIEHNLSNSNINSKDGEIKNLDTILRSKINEKKPNPKSYESFYAGFNPEKGTTHTTDLSSTRVQSDDFSKGSEYQEMLSPEDKNYKSDYSLPNSTSLFAERNTNIYFYQPKSLESVPVDTTNRNIFTKSNSANKKSDWKETLNHSRLLQKDFFINIENTSFLQQDSSHKREGEDEDAVFSVTDSINEPKKNENIAAEYPSYLLNSSTKAYTSKVIEDYKKEIQAINNLHDLTMKDIKSEAVSPTPLHLDRMFEECADVGEGKSDHSFQNSDKLNTSAKTICKTNRQDDITKVSTKELIQNYLKVKGGDYISAKNLKKKFIKSNSDGEESTSLKWHCKNKVTSNDINENIKNTTLKNQSKQNGIPNKNIPLSARIESVQNDKDVVSWMSMSAPSPRVFEVDELCNHPTDKSKAIDKNIYSSGSGDAKKDSIQKGENKQEIVNIEDQEIQKPRELTNTSTVFDIYSMLKEIERYGENPFHVNKSDTEPQNTQEVEKVATPKDNFTEIFEFLEKVEKSTNDALSMVTDSNPQTIPKLETLLRLPQTELAQRLVTASLQLEERSCCIALLQESLSNHKEQMISKIGALEKQSIRNVSKVKQECEAAIKRHQNFIDQLINDKKTLNHRIEQLVDERRSMEERWKRSAQTLEERYKLELKNQHDKMVAAQQVARQRWVRQKAEKIKELTVKGLEGELREMADRQQKEISDLRMTQAEHISRMQVKHSAELEELRRVMEEEKEAALIKERQLASSRLEKQILDLELTYQEQRTKLVNDMRAENDRLAAALEERERTTKQQIDEWRQEQERMIEEKRFQKEAELVKQKENIEEEVKQHRKETEEEFERYKREFEAEQQAILKRKVTEISTQHKLERDREIEKAIESMEAEAQQGRKELQEALRRNKEQYEIELKELAETEQATLKRYQDAQARIRQTEAKCAELEVAISQLETRNRILVEKNTQLEERAEEVRASCENSWKSKLEQCRAELEELKKSHEEQMHQLYAKVKVAVARKDSAIQALTRESAKAQEKITLLEQKLQQQRKDFLKQK